MPTGLRGSSASRHRERCPRIRPIGGTGAPARRPIGRPRIQEAASALMTNGAVDAAGGPFQTRNLFIAGSVIAPSWI